MSITNSDRADFAVAEHDADVRLQPMTPVVAAALNAHYRDFRAFLVRRVGDQATAEDILQDFCIRVMRNGNALRDDRTVIGWLYTVLRSALTDHYRKEAVRHRIEGRYVQDKLVLDDAMAEPGMDDAMCNCLNGLVAEVRPDYAEVLQRVDLREESRATVARDLGISQQNLRVRLHRARAALGIVLKHHCGDCCEAGYDDCICNEICTLPDHAGVTRHAAQ